MENIALLSIVEDSLKAADISYKAVACDPEAADTAAFCATYGYSLAQSANTIIVVGKGNEPTYAVCIVLATTKLDVNKKVRQLLGVKKASFASAEQTVNVSGMEIGGVTVFGISDLPVFVDLAVLSQPEIIMGGGNRTSKLILNPKELNKLPNIVIVEDLAKPKE